MSSITFFGPLLPGKEEPWRRFLQQLLGSRLEEYEALRRRLGVSGEKVWLVRSRRCDVVVVRLEVEQPESGLRKLADSCGIFDVWFKEKLGEFHGCDLSALAWSPAPELVFEDREANWKTVPERRPGKDFSVS